MLDPDEIEMVLNLSKFVHACAEGKKSEEWVELRHIFVDGMKQVLHKAWFKVENLE